MSVMVMAWLGCGPAVTHCKLELSSFLLSLILPSGCLVVYVSASSVKHTGSKHLEWIFFSQWSLLHCIEKLSFLHLLIAHRSTKNSCKIVDRNFSFLNFGSMWETNSKQILT